MSEISFHRLVMIFENRLKLQFDDDHHYDDDGDDDDDDDLQEPVVAAS